MSDKEKKTCDCGCEHDHFEHDHCEHDHCEHDCDCGCEQGFEVVTLTLDDGKTADFGLAGIIELDGEQYAGFEPIEEVEGVDESDFIIYKLGEENEDGMVELVPVEDEAVLDAVFDEFCRIFEEEEMAEEAEKLDK